MVKSIIRIENISRQFKLNDYKTVDNVDLEIDNVTKLFKRKLQFFSLK